MEIYQKIKSNKAWLACCLITLIILIFTTTLSRKIQNIYKIEGNVKNHLVWADTDSLSYILHAQNSEGNMRLRWATLDNYPTGRPIYWSNIFIWALKAGGQIEKYIAEKTLQPITREEAIENSAIIWNPIFLFIGAILLSKLLIDVCGTYLGSTIYFAILFLPVTLLGAFNPSYPHHRGLSVIINAIFFVTLALGYKTNNRKMFIIAGVAAGFGLWLSTINTMPFIAIAAISSLVSLFTLNKNDKESIENTRRNWKILGWCGGCTSLTGWGIEYCPNIPLELEVNSPLHSLFLIGGCYIVSLCYCYIGNLKPKKGDEIIAICFTIPFLLTLIYMGNDALLTMQPISKRILSLTLEIKRVSTQEFLESGGYIILVLTVISTWIVTNSWEKINNNTKSVIVYAGCVSIAMWCLSIEATRLKAPTIIISCTLLSIIIGLTKSRKNIPIIITGTTIILLLTLHNISTNINTLATTLTKEKSMLLYSIESSVANRAKLLNNIYKNKKEKPAILAADINDSTIYQYYLSGYVGPTVYWEAMPAVEKAALILGNANETIAKKTLLENGFDYIDINNIKEAASYIYAVQGEKDFDLEDYTIGKWANPKTRPYWLIPEKELSTLLKVDKEKLKQDIEKNSPKNHQ